MMYAVGDVETQLPGPPYFSDLLNQELDLAFGPSLSDFKRGLKRDCIANAMIDAVLAQDCAVLFARWTT
eukprot:782445-Pyramimonas_sp.AAC.1